MRNLHIFSDESMPNTPNQTPTSNQKAFTQSKTPNTPKIHQIRQKKHQLRQKNTKYAKKKHQILQNTPNFHLRCFVAGCPGVLVLQTMALQVALGIATSVRALNNWISLGEQLERTEQTEALLSLFT